ASAWQPFAAMPTLPGARRHPRTPARSPYTTLFRSYPHDGQYFTYVIQRLGSLERLGQLRLFGSVSNEGQERSLVIFRRCYRGVRSEEHTSELQSRFDLVCRLLLENKTQAQKQRRTS